MKELVGLLLLMLCFTASANHDVYPFETPQKRQQFIVLLKQFRCLVCQNQDLNESNAPLAVDLKDTIYHQLQAHKSPEEIAEYLRIRFGDFVLFHPPLNTATYGLWFTPFLLLFFAFCTLLFVIKRRQQFMDDA